MDEYIKKETAYRAIMGERPEAREPSWFAEMILDIPAVDAVEVVRCKDCIRYKNDVACSKHSRGSCEFDNERKSRNHFCSYGERRTDG